VSIVKLFRLIALCGLLFLAACTTQAAPTPVFTRLPTFTPQIYASVVVTLGARPTLEPSWTIAPTRTDVPTSTPFPTPTERPTATAIPSKTPAGGLPGVLTEEGLLTLAFTGDDFTPGLQTAQQTEFFSSQIGGNLSAKVENDFLTVALVYNDFTTRGIPATIDIYFRMFAGNISVEWRDGSRDTGGKLAAKQIEIATRLVRYTLTEISLPEAIRRYAPTFTEYQIVDAVVVGRQMLITVKVVVPTPTPSPEPISTPAS
jgi:hypothetical protein